jgi:hypothetical protein
MIPNFYFNKYELSDRNSAVMSTKIGDSAYDGDDLLFHRVKQSAHQFKPAGARDELPHRHWMSLPHDDGKKM